jgi:flagellar biosynthesis/type III secretory pathway chaperone
MDSISGEGKRGQGGEEIATKVERLVAILKGHLKNHRRLLEVMEKKRQACVRVQIEELEEAVAQERVAVEGIAQTEEERIEATAPLAEALGFSGGSRMRLLDLIQLVGEDHREELLDLRDELRDVADAMDRLNRLNRTLVLHSLEHVHLFLILLKGADPEAKLYNQDGEEGSKADPILLDRRI